MGLTLSTEGSNSKLFNFDNADKLFNFDEIKKTRTIESKNGMLIDGYNSNIYRYPLDLGEADRGHYMVIHINEQKKSRFASGGNGDLPTIYTNRVGTSTPTLGSSLDKDIDAVKSAIKNVTSSSSSPTTEPSKTPSVVRLTQGSPTNATKASTTNNITPSDIGLTDDSFGFSVGFTRTIQRSAETIALYMPDTLNFVYNQSYSDLNIGGGIVSALLTGGASAVDSVSENPNNTTGVLKDMAKNLTPFALSMLANSSDIGKAFFAAGAQMVQNPMLELIYTSPAFRTFKFDFAFYPKSQKEAYEVQMILKRLRLHQAPEINLESNGFFLIPPSEFDIKFYYNGTENPNIPKISTCILESIDIDYAPNGFYAFESEDGLTPKLGGTGMPVAIKLSLQFKEAEYLTKDHIHAMGY